MKARSLRDCFQAKVLGTKIYCAKGHKLGNVHTRQMDKGKPLIFKVCQECVDFDPDTDPDTIGVEEV